MDITAANLTINHEYIKIYIIHESIVNLIILTEMIAVMSS